MAAKTTRPAINPSPKSVSTLIREAISKKGFKDVKDCARSIRVPYDLFNKVVGGHLPKDAQLLEYAKKLDVDPRELILASYRERAPEEMKQYFNSIALLDGHNATIRELMELLDASNADQLKELLSMARMIRTSSRDYCRKALALVELYQKLDPAVMDHLDSLILLSLRRESLAEVKAFRDAIEVQKVSRAGGRRGRLRA